jgi:hypothetical protein
MQPAPVSVLPDPTRSPALKARFAAWVAIVLAVLAGPLWSMAGYQVADVIWNVAGVTILLLLLRSTPTGAIRVPRLLSVLLLTGGMIWLFVAHDQKVPLVGVLLGLVVGASSHRDAGGVRSDGSPWIAAACVWHPMLWLVPEAGEWSSTSFPARPAIWVGAFSLVIATMLCLDRRRGASPRIQWLGWLSWLAAGAATVVLVMRWPPPP